MKTRLMALVVLLLAPALYAQPVATPKAAAVSDAFTECLNQAILDPTASEPERERWWIACQREHVVQPPPTPTLAPTTPIISPLPEQLKRSFPAKRGGAFTDCADVTEIPVSECEALVALYDSSNGTGWINNSGWLQTSQPCSWKGITCANGHIVVLDLGENRLIGIIPVALEALSHLRWLGLFSNALTGPIPEELGNLSQLERLYLDDNALSGTIPPSLGKLSFLIDLFLRKNQLTGSIPASLGQLTNLEGLDLNTNSLSGAMPHEIGQLAQLDYLGLHANELTGEIPSELGQLAELNYFYLNENKLTGSIPPSLGNLTKVVDFFLHKNQLTGSIPTELGKLTAVQRLSLGYNELTGPIPPSLSNLNQLTEIYFPFNRLNGPIPPEFGALSSIVELDLSWNELTGSIPPEIGNMGSLNQLWLIDNQLSGPIPPEIGTLSSLDSLYLGLNDFSGTLPPEIGQLENLKILDISHTMLEGPLPPEIGQLRNVQEIFLSSNNLSGELPATISQLIDLRRFEAPNNAFTGTIPASIGKLHNLTSLWLSGNQLKGALPSELGQLQSVEQLVLSQNEITGTIPPEIGQLKNLEILLLDNNMLMGTLPPELGNLSSLRSLMLLENQLSGEIPPWLGQLENLESLILGNNDFTGDVPSTLGQLEKLDNLSLYNNKLSGEIPEEIGDLKNLRLLYLNDNQLTGDIPPEIGQLRFLQNLVLYENQLTGDIPPEIGQLSILRTLSLFDNNLSGTIPPELGRLQNIRWLLLQNNQFSGALPYELTSISTLTVLDVSGNASVCSPPDATFQTWIQAIPNARGIVACSPPEPPNLHLPRNQSQHQPLQTQLRWLHNPQSENDHIQVATEPTFTDLIHEDSTLVDTTVTLTNLTHLKTYHWRIRSGNTWGWSPWSAPRNFTTIVAPPDTLTLPSPSEPPLVSNSPTLSWPAHAHIDTYHFQLSTDSLFQYLAYYDSTLTQSRIRLDSLTYDALYFWRVRGQNRSGIGPWSLPQRFYTQIAPPSAILLIAPDSAAANLPRHVTLSWDSTTTATSYHAQLWVTSAVVPSLLEDSTLTTTQWSLDSLHYATTYAWHVRARNPTGWGPWSQTRSFSTQIAPPQATQLLNPPDEVLKQPSSITFAWAETPTATTYAFELATDSLFTDITHHDTTLIETSFTLGPLAYSTTFFWRTRAQNTTGWGAWSDAFRFTVAIGTSTETESLPKRYALHPSYPNPFNPSTVIRFDVPQAGPVDVRIYNALGQQVAVVASGERAVGRYDLRWDASDLASGVYVVRMEAHAFSATQTLVLKK